MKNKLSITRALATALVVASLIFCSLPDALAQGPPLPGALQGQNPLRAVRFLWQGNIVTGNTTTGAVSITISSQFISTFDGTVFQPGTVFATLTPILVNDANAETVTPTSISVVSCPVPVSGRQCVTINGTFNNLHGASNTELVLEGTYGLQTAMNYAFSFGGGKVTVDTSWAQLGGTTAMLAAAIPYWSVALEDTRTGLSRFWRPTPTGATIAAPTLPAIVIAGQLACDATHQSCSDATVAGSASWSGAVYLAIAYMDCMGNEGPPSATTNWTSAASKAIDIGAPAASPGACGWVPYLSLSGGTYAQAYQIPPTSTVCTLSTLTPIPSCALANANYVGTVTSTFGAGGLFTRGGAQVTGYPVNTAQHFTNLASVVQTTAAYTPVSNGSVSYAYAPSNGVGNCGISPSNVNNYAAGASSTAAIPMAIATWSVPANCFNYVGAEFRVSGKFTWTDGGAADINKVIVGWDAALSNATTIPTILCDIENTHTAAAAAQVGTYTCTIRTATTGATGTAKVNGSGNFTIATGQVLLIGTANDVAVAASAATVNWTVPARITVQYFNSGATANPGAQGLEATLEVLN